MSGPKTPNPSRSPSFALALDAARWSLPPRAASVEATLERVMQLPRPLRCSLAGLFLLDTPDFDAPGSVGDRETA